MAQIRKGFIAANAIDGTKLKLLNNDAIRAANADGTDAELMKLDSSNVLQFLKMPQVSSDPSAANDLARKSYVDSKVDTAKGDVDAALAAEQAAREAADSGLQSAIDTEVSDRQAAVSAEAAAREAADAGLQSAIDTEKGRIDAILSAATADADSFAEIVNLINSVDTTNDQAFASYVLSNDAALAQEVSDRQSGDQTLQNNIDAEASARASAVSSEASARQAADTTLQSNIDAEASARAAAVSAEQSARESADAALQAAIDDLDIAELASVNITNAQDGDLWQFDLDSGKWVNVAPLSEATTTSVVVPGSETLIASISTAPESNDGVGAAIGMVYRPGNNVALSKVGFKIGRSSNLVAGMTVTGKIYQVSQSIADTDSAGQFNSANFTLVGTSTNTIAAADMALYPSVPNSLTYFTFDNVQLTANTYYILWAVVDGVTLGSNTPNYLSQWYTVAYGSFPYNHYKQLTPSGGVRGDLNVALAHELYTGSAGTTSTEASVGVIKTNSDGMLDDSFLAYDVNFGGHKLQGVSSPAVGTDAANKDYVDGQVSSEASARQSADSQLQSNIDAEASARASAVSSEASARQAADSQLQSNIDSEVSARQAAVSAEQSAREAADSDLQDQIDALDSGSNAALTQEIADRQAADAVLQGNIDTEKARIDAILLASDADKDSFAEIVNLINSVDTENDNAFASYVLSNDAALAQEVSDRTAAVSAEAAARSAADADLASDLADETAAREAADSAESAARQAADSTLQSNIDAEVAARQAAVSAEEAARTAADADLASDLSDEAAARSAADTTLQSNIDSEAAARAAGDSAEQAAREAADATLQSNIDSEAAARQMADSAETAAREAADSALDVRLDAIEAVTHRKEKFTLTSTDLSNGYVDLAVTCVTDSEMVFVGALYLHDGDHYTTSVVNSKTRISFAGDMVVGGLSELVAGDVVYVRYQSAQTPSGGEGGGGGDTGGGGGGGGEPTGPLSLSFMGAGESMMGPESIDIGWSATNGTNDTYYYLYEVTGPSTYSNPIYLNSGGTWGTVLKSQIDPMKFYVIGGGSMDTSIPPEAVTSSFQMPDGTAGT